MVEARKTEKYPIHLQNLLQKRPAIPEYSLAKSRQELRACCCLFWYQGLHLALTEWLSRGGWTTTYDLRADEMKLLHTTVKNIMLTKP